MMEYIATSPYLMGSILVVLLGFFVCILIVHSKEQTLKKEVKKLKKEVKKRKSHKSLDELLDKYAEAYLNGDNEECARLLSQYPNPVFERFAEVLEEEIENILKQNKN